MRYMALALHLDSLGEAYGFPSGYRDPSFHEVLERFLKLAEKYKFKYSVYIIGKDLENSENRKCVKEWSLQGHEIGNHSWSHPANLGAMSKADILKELKSSHEIIRDTVGYEPKGFASPAWCVSSTLFEVLIELKYTYDISLFPSWLMYPVLLKLLLNFSNDKRVLSLLHRKDFLYFLLGRRNPFNTSGSLFRKSNNIHEERITALPMPTNRFGIACWHTQVFMFGWKIHEKILRSCLKDVDAFYYVVHPADLMDERDLIPGRKICIERLTTSLEQKLRYLENFFEIVLESGREIVTVKELAGKFGAK